MLRKILLTCSLFLLPINSLLAVDWGKELGDHSGVDLKVQSIMDPYIDAVKEISPKFNYHDFNCEVVHSSVFLICYYHYFI